MADPALKSTAASTLFTAASLKALIASLLLYWGACALLLPVTTSDCQVYNLARLRVAERAGFWQAEAWNSVRQVTYPWAFDAVHYPFLKTAWGFGIPSFTLFAIVLALLVFGAPLPDRRGSCQEAGVFPAKQTTAASSSPFVRFVPSTRCLFDRSWLQLGFSVIILWSAISLPLHCAQRRPLDLWNALFARADVSLRQRPEMIPVFKDVLSLRTNRTDRWFLVASENSWTFPFLDQANMKWELTPQWEQVKALLAQGEPANSYALILNNQLPQDVPFELVKKYPGSTFIVRILSTVGEKP